jgi:hypothetical protein
MSHDFVESKKEANSANLGVKKGSKSSKSWGKKGRQIPANLGVKKGGKSSKSWGKKGRQIPANLEVKNGGKSSKSLR